MSIFWGFKTLLRWFEPSASVIKGATLGSLFRSLNGLVSQFWEGLRFSLLINAFEIEWDSIDSYEIWLSRLVITVFIGTNWLIPFPSSLEILIFFTISEWLFCKQGFNKFSSLGLDAGGRPPLPLHALILSAITYSAWVAAFLSEVFLLIIIYCVWINGVLSVFEFNLKWYTQIVKLV